MNTRLLFLTQTLFFFSILGFSQSNVDPQAYLPTISPVSPEAASLGQYGDIPVNLSTGRLSYNVPLYNISAGDTQFPLSLSYNYGGFMPEGTPSMTGLGWAAFLGGAITRKMNGREDELNAIGYMALAERLNDYITAVQSEQDLIIHKSGDNSWDTEPDEFIINTGTISGSFYLGENNVPIFKINKNYKVELLPYTQKINGFIITDANGIKYTFGAIEEAQYIIYETLDSVTIPNTIDYNSSWMLTEIAFPNSTDLITFEYTSYTSEPEVRTKFIKESQGSGNLCSDTTYTETNIYDNISQVLNRINFPNGYITINTTNKTIYEGIVLDDMSIFNSNNRLINKYTFNYFNPDKFYHVLTSIEKETVNMVEDYFSFEYNDLNSLPTSKSYNSDLWGFYNSGSNHLSDFNRGKYGSLKKIIYPTKGHTELEYETNKVAIDGGPSCDFSPNQTHTVNNFVEEDTNGEELTITETLTLDKDQVIRVTLSVYTTNAEQDADVQIFPASNPSANSPCPGVSTFYQTNYYLTISGEDEFEQGQDEEGVLSKNISQLFYATAGVYTLTTNVFSTTTDRARAKIEVDYSENLTSDNVGGIRVSKTIDCSNNGSPCIEKLYKYINDDDTSSGLLLSDPKYLASEIELTGTLSGTCQQKVYAYRSVIPLASYQGSHVLYKRVETRYESNGSNNGKRVNNFSGNKNYSIGSPYPSKDYKDWKKGLLENDSIYKYENSQYVLLKETKNTFEETNFLNEPLLPQTISISAIRNRYSYSEGGGFPGLFEHSDDRDYLYVEINQTTNLYHNIKTESRTFENGVAIENIATYSYDSPYGQLKETKTTTSKSDEFLINRLTYPYDETGTIPNLLIGKNMINVPIETETYKEVATVETLLATQRSEYKDWGSNIVLPEFIKASKKNEALTTHAVFYDYSTDGKPVDVSKADDSHTYYIWGYQDNLPIAKLENFESSQKTPAILSLIAAAVSASNLDDDRTIDIINPNGSITKVGKEGDLREALTALRNSLSNAMVSTYTYDPLIGVTSMTDPKGYTMYYEYDEFNRLIQVKDAEGNIVSENRYHYKE